MGESKHLYIPLTRDQVDTSRVRFRFILPIITVVLSFIIIIQNAILVRARYSTENLRITPLGLSRERTIDRRLYSPSVYTSPNETEAAIAWGKIRVGRGLVALDEQYIVEHNLPKSFKWPEDRSKHIYTIEAYHAMHCVVNIRLHYQALDRGESGDWPREHDLHCFNSLRQYIMCNPDDTLLNSTGNRDSGHGLQKKCQNWDALRDWAGQYSSGYHFHDPKMDGSDLGPWMHDYIPGDGLEWG